MWQLVWRCFLLAEGCYWLHVRGGKERSAVPTRSHRLWSSLQEILVHVSTNRCVCTWFCRRLTNRILISNTCNWCSCYNCTAVNQPLQFTIYAGAVLENNIWGQCPQSEVMSDECRRQENLWDVTPSGVGNGRGVPSFLNKNIWDYAPTKWRPSGKYQRRENWGAERAGVCGGVSPPQTTRGFGENCELLSWVMGGPRGGNAFLLILKATECSFLHLYAYALTFMSHCGGGKANVWGGQLPHAPT